ncbi:MAG: hypothetical protein K0R51_1673 [Cytophagaceae bacterium]|jgi:hypothetical protein|nr:hypothetical protein [Cytophagaceae bacterium]
MKWYSYFLALSSIAVISLSSCENETGDGTNNPPIDSSLLVKPDTINKDSIKPAATMKQWNFSAADEKVILMPEKLSMGASYKTIEKILPDFKGVRAENRSAELADKGFVEGMSETNLFGQKAKCVFHFKNDSLYSYDVSVPIMDMKEAEKKYNEIKAFYNSKYGEAQTPKVEEDNYTSTTSFWKTPKGYVVLTNDLSNAEIQFGIHNTLPK